ncbi:hypothetical protein N7462_002306 [Penicillium macrosclerotiorum]|uniref:uncharacterized protein n=1 Tax=Penicillium macrosclerotiorum TaxID=303699 RepID=UPI0025490CFA|nr:uncharacterized protein N7462_002306 [Penicillium macrosclerotiorum]KAJ5692883.1 hypothetical protein N7462_002306 [Penicillium macrosclerotiorum]
MSETHLHPGRRTGLRSVEARICLKPPSLCLRIQELAIASRQSASHLFPGQLPVEVCRHIGTHSSKFIEMIDSPITNKDKVLPSSRIMGNAMNATQLGIWIYEK